MIVALTAAAGCGGGSEPPAAAPPSPAAVAAEAPKAAAVGPCTQEVPVAVNAVGWHDMKWKDNHGRGEGPDPHVVLALPNYGGICTVRLRFTLTTPDGKPAFFQVFWRRRGGTFNERDQQSAALNSSPQEQTFIASVNADIDSLRIDPDTKPMEFKLSEMVLSTPAGAAPR